MTSLMLIKPELGPAVPVSTTDMLKALALVFILVDHVGHFLADGVPLLRVIGRFGVPIFFFLIGFGKSRHIPRQWLALGAVLTMVDFLWTGSLAKTQVNILFNFAAIRLALPWIEQHAIGTPARFAILLLVLLSAIPFVAPVVEYGTEGWLFSITGLLHRRVIDGVARSARFRDVAGLVALGAFVVVERIDYQFDAVMSTILVLGVAALAGFMHGFARGDLVRQPGPRLGAIMRFCGCYSLEIYATQIILLAAAGGLWNHFTDNPREVDDDEFNKTARWPQGA